MKPGLEKAAFKESVRPQDDLFRHVNGKWLDETEIPEDKAIHGSFHMLADDSELAVKEILEEASKNPRPGVSQQIGDLYACFMAEDHIESLGAKPLEPELARVDAVETIAELFRLIGELESEGVGGFWGSYVDNDPGNPERYLLHFYQGGLGLPDRDYYFDEKYEDIRKDYLPHLEKMLSLANVPDAAARAKSIYELETKIAQLHWNRVDSRDAEKTYNLHSLQDLKTLASGIPWDEYISALGKGESLLEWNVVMMPSFFEGFAKLASEENLEAMKDALRMDLIRGYAPYLSKDLVAERFEFYGKKLTGAPMNRPRWKRAVSLVEGSLGEAIGQIYVEKHFPPEAKQQMDALVDYLIQAYEQSIKSLDWMTDETKQKALTKLSKFTPKIGYPVRWKDYSSIKISRDHLIENVKAVSRWEFDYHAGKIGSPIDRDEWHMTPQTVNAYYNPGLNEIVFPAAILQPPFFSPEADPAENFGGIGAVIGHEIGHGFDDQGSKYDGDGRLVSWWTEADRKAFEARTKSLIDQFSALTPAQLDEKYKVNGELTIGENIGDLGGLGIAWKAYLISLDGQEPPVIDGLTAAQRFLMSWAQCWRNKGRDEITIQRLAVDPHSPPEFRANQVVKNLDIYHEAFEVSEEDQMWLAKDDRVVIW
ncbi:MAG: peptidase M13 [Actinobacteria bacterium]|nr:peptidase M13 [Actinomycetota bacterium]NCW94992.1 peptidase M13 [Actinomycetota bacterium]